MSKEKRTLVQMPQVDVMQGQLSAVVGDIEMEAPNDRAHYEHQAHGNSRKL
jgi:hypothetical protein